MRVFCPRVFWTVSELARELLTWGRFHHDPQAVYVFLSSMHDACQKFCAVRQRKKHREPNSVLNRNRGTLMCDEDGRHSMSTPFRLCSEKTTFRECTGHRVARRGAPMETDQFLKVFTEGALQHDCRRQGVHAFQADLGKPSQLSRSGKKAWANTASAQLFLGCDTSQVVHSYLRFVSHLRVKKRVLCVHAWTCVDMRGP